MPSKLKQDREEEIHIWCDRETKHLVALYTISFGKRCICQALPRRQALYYLGAFLDELAEDD